MNIAELKEAQEEARKLESRYMMRVEDDNYGDRVNEAYQDLLSDIESDTLPDFTDMYN